MSAELDQDRADDEDRDEGREDHERPAVHAGTHHLDARDEEPERARARGGADEGVDEVVVVGRSAGTTNSTPAAVHSTAARSAAATAHQLESALWRIATVTTRGASPYAITVVLTATIVPMTMGSVMPPAAAAASALAAPTNAAADPIRSHIFMRPR
ncbi:MAG TPA: hypothetical protein VI056_05835 [Candidatus Limnocylindria bacterium]